MTNVSLRAAILTVAIASMLCVPATAYAVDPAPLLVESDVSRVWTCGWYTVGLLGQNIQQGATIKLVKSGQPDFIATDILIIKQAHWTNAAIRCRFNIGPGTAGGMWSIQLTNPDSQVSTLPNVIEVVPNCARGAAGDVYVSNYLMTNILQFDGETGEFVCVFTNTFVAGSPSFPGELIWAPNGNLWVVFPKIGGGPSFIREYDGNTGVFIRNVTPNIPFPSAVTSVSMDGLDGSLYTMERVSPADNTKICKAYTVNLINGALQYLRIAAEPDPPMNLPETGKFLSNGNYLISGLYVGGGPTPTLREYDSQTWEMIHEVLDTKTKRGFVESIDGNSYLVACSSDNLIQRYSTNDLAYIDTPIPASSCLSESICGSVPVSQPDPSCCSYKAMRGPFDVTIGPTGLLFVIANGTFVPRPGTAQSEGALHIFDPATGQQIKVAGRQVVLSSSSGGGEVSERIFQATSLELKPLPGDYASSGGVFLGDWRINENDLAKFVDNFRGEGNTSSNPHARLSFDFDHDGDIDCADWPPFAAAFLASSGYSPPLPLPNVDDFVSALLGASGRSCFADRNGDGTVDGLDLQPFVDQFVQP